MAIYYCWSGGTGTAPYDTWAKAAQTFNTAINAASANGDQIRVADDHIEELSVDTTFTFLADISVIGVSRASGLAAAMGGSAWIGNSSSNRSIILSGAFKIYHYGITYRIAGSTSDSMQISNLDGAQFEFEKCDLWQGNTNASSQLRLGSSSSINGYNCYIKLKDCTFRLGNTAQSISIKAAVEMINCRLSTDGAAPSNLFTADNTDSGGATLDAFGCDFSHAGSGNIIGSSTGIALRANLYDCKLGESFSMLASQTPANKGGASVKLSNCSAGDEHYHFAYADAFGEITCVESPYCDDGAKYDGTNPVAWRIITTSAANYYSPFVTPWIEKYHAGTSAITPFVEILNNASATALQNDEIWSEFGAQTIAGSTQATYTSNRMTLLGSADNQDAGTGLAGWTGESGTAWSGKLVSSSAMTPAEIGTLKARVFVGQPSITVFVDPTIRT